MMGVDNRKEIKIYFIEDDPDKIEGFSKLFTELNELNAFKYVNVFASEGVNAARDYDQLRASIAASKPNNSLWILDIEMNEYSEYFTVGERLFQELGKDYPLTKETINERYEHYYQNNDYLLFRGILENLLMKDIPFVIGSTLVADGIPHFVATGFKTINVYGLLTSDKQNVRKRTAAEIEKYLISKIVNVDPINVYLDSIRDLEDHISPPTKESYKYLDPLAELLKEGEGEKLLKSFDFLGDNDSTYVKKNFFEEVNKAARANKLSLGLVLTICWAAQLRVANEMGIEDRKSLFEMAVKDIASEYNINDHSIKFTHEHFVRSRIINNPKQSTVLFKRVVRRLYELMTMIFQHEKTGKATLTAVVPELRTAGLLTLSFEIPDALIEAANTRRYELDRIFSTQIRLSQHHKFSFALLQWLNLLGLSDLEGEQLGAISFGSHGGLLIESRADDHQDMIDFKFAIS